MAKQSGLGARFYLDGVNLSGDIGGVDTLTSGFDALEMTGIDKSAIERVAGQLTGSIQWTGFFNPDGEHPVLSAQTRNDRIGSYWHRAALAQPVASIIAKQLDYAWNRGDDGALELKVETQSNAFPLEWGLSLTAGARTDGTATNGTGVDFSAGHSFGAQAYLHVFSFTGTSATIKLQHSNDNGAGDAWSDVTGGAFAAVTSGPQAQRLATGRALAVKRWLRVVTTGTFSALNFAVSAAINGLEYVV